MGLQMEWGASLTAPVNSRILKHFLRMIFAAMDSILRLVLSGCLLQILSEQQCLKNAGKFHCLRGFIVGTRKKFQTPVGNHKCIPYSKPKKCVDQFELYGTPKDLDDFCLKVNQNLSLAILDAFCFFLWVTYLEMIIRLNWLTTFSFAGQLDFQYLE